MNNKKLFKGALVLFASILMAISCQSNSKPGDDDTTQKPGDTTKQETVTLAKKDLVDALKAIGTIGETGANKSGQYNFGDITDIAKDSNNGKTTPETITGTGAETKTSKTATKTLMEGAFASLAAKGFKVEVDASGFDGANSQTAVNLTLTITPAPETKDKKYEFDKDLTEVLVESKLVIKIKPTSGVDWQ